jgi:hypothetical protein
VCCAGDPARAVGEDEWLRDWWFERAVEEALAEADRDSREAFGRVVSEVDLVSMRL